MTKRAFGRREGEEQIPWLMHTCPRLLPRWSSKRLLRSESYYVSGREITLDRPSLLGARPGSMGWCGVVTKEDGYTAIDVRLSHVDVGEHDVRPQAFVGQYKVRGTFILADGQLEAPMRA